ncbi:T9SS C-terminal target domain-containing protein [bacterium]|nr:T9SS C-terminal target domain-containing protein [bacterium]
MKKILLLLFFVCELVSAQPMIEWEHSFGGSMWDEAYSIVSTMSDKYVVAARSASNDSDLTENRGYYDYWIFELDSSGELIWQNVLGGSDWDVPGSIVNIGDSCFVVAGYSGSNDFDVTGNHGRNDFWVVKLNSIGNMLWQHCYGGTQSDGAYSIVHTTDNGYIIAGFSGSNDGDVSGHHGEIGYPHLDCWIVKVDSLGAIEWQKSLGGTGEERAYSIIQTTDGGYAFCGYTWSDDGDVSGIHSTSAPDYWVVKLDSIGEIEWQKCLGGTDGDYAYSIDQTIDGGYVVVGHTESHNGDVRGYHGSNDVWVVKLDSLGELEWQKCLGGNSCDFGTYILSTNDTGMIISAYSMSNNGDVSGNHGNYDYWIIKIDKNGELEWQKCFGGSDAEQPNCLTQNIDGDLIIAGNSKSSDGDVSVNKGSGDVWIVKIKSLLIVETTDSFDGAPCWIPDTVENRGDYIFLGPSDTIRIINISNDTLDIGFLVNDSSTIWKLVVNIADTSEMSDTTLCHYDCYSLRAIFSDTIPPDSSFNDSTAIVYPDTVNWFNSSPYTTFILPGDTTYLWLRLDTPPYYSSKNIEIFFNLVTRTHTE